MEDLAAEFQRRFSLTEREAEIACALASSRRSDEIARSLGISMNTLKTHRRRIYEKVGVRRHAELMMVGFEIERVSRRSADSRLA